MPPYSRGRLLHSTLTHKRTPETGGDASTTGDAHLDGPPRKEISEYQHQESHSHQKEHHPKPSGPKIRDPAQLRAHFWGVNTHTHTMHTHTHMSVQEETQE